MTEYHSLCGRLPAILRSRITKNSYRFLVRPSTLRGIGAAIDLLYLVVLSCTGH